MDEILVIVTGTCCVLIVIAALAWWDNRHSRQVTERAMIRAGQSGLMSVGASQTSPTDAIIAKVLASPAIDKIVETGIDKLLAGVNSPPKGD